MLDVRILAASVGFLSLAIEILWIRLFSLANHSIPQAFAFVLIFYLCGIALGAKIGKLFCKAHMNLWHVSGVFLLSSAILDYATPWIYAYFVENKWQLTIAAICITVTALQKAILFPITHYLGTIANLKNISSSLAKVYAANIFGATLGPLFSAVLLSFLSTQQSYLICAMLSAIIGMSLLIKQVKMKFITITTCILLSVIALVSFSPHKLLRLVLIKGHIIKIIENQYGVVATYAGGAGGDYITGGNVYDGRTNLDPILNTNGIHRVLILSTLVKKPEHILVIGLSIGSWLKLATTFPYVKQVDVIEINPSYIQALKDYPMHASILSDSRVHIYFDDVRRWLKLHPEKQYDLVIANNTYHWRAYSANLLSKEFLLELKKHMKANAVYGYNPTSSLHVLKTASDVFKHAYVYDNFVIAADFDWRPKLKQVQAFQRLSSLQLNGRPLFYNDVKTINNFLHKPILSIQDIMPYLQKAKLSAETITDNNLITEYKYGKSL